MALNILDIIIIVVLAAFALRGYKRGFVLTFFDFFSFLASILLTNILYPLVSSFLSSNKGFFEFVKQIAQKAFPLDDFIQGAGKAAELEFINALSLPDFLKNPLLENNNPDIYKMLGVSSLTDYIHGFMANLFIGIIAMIFVFIAISFGLKLVAHSLNIVAKLPIINTFNKGGGVAAGLLQGVVFLWFIVAVSTLFTTNPDFTWLHDLVGNSVIARYFYSNNFILDAVLSIF